MSCSKLSKVSKQHQNTWAQLHRRLISIPFSYEDMFPREVYEFVKNQALSTSSCIGYMVPCLLTTTAFVAGMNNSVIALSTEHNIPLNLYTMVVGPPTTGKSQSMRQCSVEPLVAVQDNYDLGNFVVERSTSSGLIKCIAQQRKAFLCSPEIYDVLNKLLKSDEDSGTGDVQLLCSLFSGERTSFRYATESTREISSNVPFCIMGSTQVPFAARLICRLDQGHGLLDRFLVCFPVCFRPTPTETEDAKAALDRLPLKSFTDLFIEMYNLHLEKKVFDFSAGAKEMLDSLNADFIKAVNEAIAEGVPPPKSKRVELLQRISVCLHVLTHTLNSLVRGRKPRATPKEVSLDTVKKAILFLDYVESKKQIIIDISDL